MRLLAFMLAAGILLSGCASDDPGVAADPLADSDGDGFPDSLEAKYETDPQNASDVPKPVVHKDITFTDSGLIIAGTEVPAAAECGTQGTVDKFSTTWRIDAPANATDVHVTDLVFTATLPATMVELDIIVFGPDGRQLTEATTMSLPPLKTDTVTVDTKQPVGDYTINILGCLGSGEVILDATGVLGYTPSIEELLHEQGVQHEH